MSNPNTLAENKMGVAPVNKLLLTMALPIVGSMLVQALYNVVDSIFVSQFDENALSAVSIAFSIQSIIIAIGIGTNTGVNALLSRSLGEKNHSRIHQITQHALFLTLACTVVVTIASFFFIKPFMRLMTTPETTQIYQYGVEYLYIVCGFSFFSFAVITLERLLNATGKTHLMTVSQVAGAVVNIILDPLMIFGYGPFPVMGVAGAAAATMIAQAVGVVISLVINLKKNKELDFSMKGFRPNGGLIKEIYKIGIPSGMIMLLNSFTTMLLNRLLISFTETAVAVLGAYFKLNSFIFFPIFSLNQANVAIVAYNLGARKKKRIDEAIRYTIIYGLIVMVIGTLIFLLFPSQLLALFNASPTMLEIGVPALRIICIIFPFAALCIIMGSVMQAVGYAFYSMITALCRQIIILVPVAYLLARIGGLNAVWWSYLIAECVSLALTLIFFRKVYDKVIRPLPE